jgi:SAM-dependent methyltransferase/predicted O-methyltransferase YrrM
LVGASYLGKRDSREKLAVGVRGDLLPGALLLCQTLGVSEAPTAPLGHLERARTLWRLFRNERDDPEPFYSFLAKEVAEQLEVLHGPLAGQLIADLGCGPGFYTRALRAKGALVLPVDAELAELMLAGAPPSDCILADAGSLPLASGTLDGVFCSNLLEHTPRPFEVLSEMARVLRPGGWGYLSWTPWWSPWGGHEMSPYHLLGPRLGTRLYETLHGPPRKNRFGEGLFVTRVGEVLTYMRSREDIEVIRVEPRYWPWANAICAVPGAREVLSWNCVIHFAKKASSARESLISKDLEDLLSLVRDIPGWFTDDQVAVLYDEAKKLSPGEKVVEIGSYQGRSTVVIAKAVKEGVEVVAIDPHAGNDRGPQQWECPAEAGEEDHQAFLANLARAGVADKVRHVRKPSQLALDALGPNCNHCVSLLFIDGAHRVKPAYQDLDRWGAKVKDGGVILLHDCFSSIGVTAALMFALVLKGDLRYVGRTGSLAYLVKEPLGGFKDRMANVGRAGRELPWFLRNVVVKVAMLAGLKPLVKALGQPEGVWPH